MHKYLWLPLFVILLAGCPDPEIEVEQDSISEGGPASEDEEYAIYSALINEMHEKSERDDKKVRPMIIMDKSSLGPIRNEHTDEVMISLNKRLKVGRGALKEFLALNKESRRFQRSFNIRVDYELISEKDFKEIFKPHVRKGWDKFYERYPDSTGCTTFSRVWLSRAKNQALVYLGIRKDVSSGRGVIILLEKANDVWGIKELALVWIS